LFGFNGNNEVTLHEHKADNIYEPKELDALHFATHGLEVFKVDLGHYCTWIWTRQSGFLDKGHAQGNGNDLHPLSLKLSNTIQVKRAYVLIVMVSDYSAFSSIDNLPCSETDKSTLLKLFTSYGYTIKCCETKKLNLDEFDDLLLDAQNHLHKHHADYDAFIFAFSGQGDAANVLLSDGNGFSRFELYQLFNGARCRGFAGKPKLFVVDACKGFEAAEQSNQMSFLTDSLVKQSKHKWMLAMHKVHVDKNIVVLNATTLGYQAYDHEGGSALIQSFNKVWSDNADALELGDMCLGINANLEAICVASGRAQAMEFIGLGRTKRIVFLKPDDGESKANVNQSECEAQPALPKPSACNPNLSNAIQVKRAYVLIVTVSAYSPVYMDNLLCAETDKSTLLKLFTGYGYTIQCSETQKINHDDFYDFLCDAQHHLREHHADYDAFIFAFSGHGDEDNVVLSDGKGFSRIKLYQLFNGAQCRGFAGKPKLFVVDASKGFEEAEQVEQSEHKATQAMHNVHVDKNIVVLNATTSGHLAYDYEGCSSLIQSFNKVWRDNADTLKLNDMCLGINANLEAICAASGRAQAVELIGMGRTKRIVFLKPDAEKNKF